MEKDPIRDLLAATEVLRMPRRRLATFGATRVDYRLISPIDGMAGRTRLREGVVVSERPKIITPDAFKERFAGFGEDAAEFERFLKGAYKDLLRALEYNFRNQGVSTRVVSDDPRLVAERAVKDLDERDLANGVVIRCPDMGWSLALMKFTLDEAARSFPTNVQDLDRRGKFGPP